jgi:two-component system nitrogen regulation sensor histidine kinase NtrY
VVLQCAALGFWLRAPGLSWAVIAAGLSICAIVAVGSSRRFALAGVAVVGLAVSLVALESSWRVRRVETAWPELRETILSSAGETLSEMLDGGVELARDLADSAASIETTTPAEAFARLEMVVAGNGPERGAVIVDSTGTPFAWAGRHRVAPVIGRAGLTAHITQFYVLLEARRQAESRIGIGQVVLWADGAVPDRTETVAERFARQTDAELEFYQAWEAPGTADVFDFTLGVDTLFSVEVIPPAQGDLKLEIVARGSRIVAFGALATLVLFALCVPMLFRWMGVAGIGALLTLTPAGNRIGLVGVFSEATYFLDLLGPFSASAGGLFVSATFCGVALVALSRHGVARHWMGLLVASILVPSAPFAIAALASGITPPSSGIGLGLWLSWETTLAVASAVLLLATASLVRGRRKQTSPTWTAWATVAIVGSLSLLGLYLWNPATGWPTWYAFLWIPPILLAVLPAPALRTVATVAVVAGAGAALLTWSADVDGRLLLAERDADRVQGGDAVPFGYLDRFGEDLLQGEIPRTTAELYALWHHSFLSQAGYPAVLASWGPDAEELARLDLADLDLSSSLLQIVATDNPDTIEVTKVNLPAGVVYLAAVPFPDGSVLTAGVGPRSRLIEDARLARFLRGERRATAPYEMSAGEMSTELSDASHVGWRRDNWTVRRQYTLSPQPGVRRALRAQVPLRGLGRLLVRGTLVIVWNALLIGLLWLLGAVLMGKVSIPPDVRQLVGLRSFRTRLTFVLAGFFLLPTLGYAAWTMQRLRGDAVRSRDLLISQTLSDAAGSARQFVDLAPEELRERLIDLAGSLNSDLIWYDGGTMQQASPVVLAELGLLDHFMPPDVYLSSALRDESETTADVVVGGQATRMGYWNFGLLPEADATLASPRLVDVRDILSEQEDLLYGLLLVTLAGIAAAAWLAAIAARSLAYPVRSLREAAEAVGSGERLPPFDPSVPTEFVSVVQAFERMAQDIDRSQSALEEARRRTATVLKNVATGVVALDRGMRVLIANPQAEALLSAPLPSGAHIHVLGGVEWVPVWKWVRGFLNGRSESDASEFLIGEVQIRAQVAVMHGEPSGCVLALDDTTELARAVRVLAWGELARQIAHEIKNPLTPIRLGIQHLKRAYSDPRGDYGHTLDRTAQQILAEIERLDSIARAFARFGAPIAETAPMESADLTLIARETAQLYSLGGETSVVVNASGPVVAKVRKDEVKEVLVNLIENARDGGASTVQVAVAVAGEQGKAAIIDITDNGRGILPTDLPHVFEPQFSTTTSGTGLGLAICKRLVESWGGTIELASEIERGTTVKIVLASP